MAATPAGAQRKLDALIAALEWVGYYEAPDPHHNAASPTISLDLAFEKYIIASHVKKAYPDFPEDMVDAYQMLRGMIRAQATKLERNAA